MSATTSSLRPYQAAGTPNIDGNDARYWRTEFTRVSDSIKQLVTAAQGLDSRLTTDEATLTAMQAAWTPYTPTVTPSSGAFTTVSASGRYKQIGKTVHVGLLVNITTNGTAAGNIQVSLPIQCSGLCYAAITGREVNVTGKMLQGYIAGGSTAMYIWNYDNSYAGGTGYAFYISAVYESL